MTQGDVETQLQNLVISTSSRISTRAFVGTAVNAAQVRAYLYKHDGDGETGKCR